MKTNDLNILSVSVMYFNVHISPKYQVLLWVSAEPAGNAAVITPAGHAGRDIARSPVCV